MFKDSLIISVAFKVWAFLKNAYLSSLYYKLFEKISGFFAKLYKNSFLYKFFDKQPVTAESSFVSKITDAFFGFFHNLFHPFVKRVGTLSRRSFILKNVRHLMKNWYAISIRYYSVALFVFTCVRLVVKRLMSQMTGPYTIALGVIAIIGIFIDTSLASLYEGSRIRKWIGFADLPEQVILRKRVKPHVSVTVALVAGAVFGIFTVVSEGWLVAAGIIGTVIMLSKPIVGVALIAACFPFIPTMGVVGLGIYLLAVTFIKYLYGEEKHVNVDLFDIMILLMCGVLVYGVLNSYAIMQSIPPTMVYLVFVASFYSLRRLVQQEETLIGILNFLVIVSAGVALYGLYQKFSGQAATTWQDTEMFETISGRIYSTFGNPNVFGEYLLLMMPVTFGLMLKSDSYNTKTSYLVIFALQAACMILTYSRGCWIGIAVSMALLIMFTSKKLTSLLVFAVLLAPLFIPQTIMDRLLSIGNTADTSTSYRVYIWQGTLRMLKDFWYCGVGTGPEAFGNVYPAYSLNAIAAPHAHNLYLHILSETGIVGLLTVLGLLVVFYRSLTFAAKTSQRLRPVAFALGTAMIGYLVQGMFDNVWYNYRIYFFFFVMLAFGAALYDVSKKEKSL